MIIKTLYEGTFWIDATKKFTPSTNNDDKTNSLKGIKVNINPFLIKTNNDLLIIDTGLGFKNNNGQLKIHENIKKYGFKADDVTKVLLTHLHIDHVSGCFFKNDKGLLTPSFKNATYYLQEKELNKMLQSNIKEEHKKILEALKKHEKTIYLNGNGYINEEIIYEITGGHSEFHQIFIIKDSQKEVLCGGDLIPQPEQLNVKFIAKYDFDGKKSLEKRQYYAEYLAKNNGICLFYHSTGISVGAISKNNNTFIITNVES